MVGAAVGAVGFWMHHHHTETQKKREELEYASAERRSLRANVYPLAVKVSESRARGWPAEHVLAGLYRHGFWEDFGREAARMLDRVFENRSRDDEAFELFPFSEVSYEQQRNSSLYSLMTERHVW